MTVSWDPDAVKIDNLALDVMSELSQKFGTIHESEMYDCVFDGAASYFTSLPPFPTPPPPPPPPAPILASYGFDVSGNQTPTEVKSLCLDSKYTFGIIKATEGQFAKNAYLADQTKILRDTGKRVGFYHFAWPNQDAAVEAKNFLDTAQPKIGDCVFLDLENWDAKNNYAAMQGVGWDQRLGYALKWLRIVREDTGAVPFVYANWDWIKGLRTACGVTSSTSFTPTPLWESLTRNPLWIAQYRSAGDYDTVNGVWDVEVQQYTTNSNTLDENWLRGPVDAKWDRFSVRKQ